SRLFSFTDSPPAALFPLSLHDALPIFTADELHVFRRQYPGVEILAHPECPPDVLAEADFVGSTSGMIRYVGESRPRRVVMVTECSMSDNVALEYPDVEFVRPCNLCPHMQRFTLPKIPHSVATM